MSVVHVALDRTVPDDLSDELAKRLYFVSSAIQSFELDRADGAVHGVELIVDAPTAELAVELREKVNRVVRDEILTQRPLSPRLVWKSDAQCDDIADCFPELVDTGVAHVAGEGQVGLGEPMISLIDRLDRRLRAIAMSLPSAAEFRYPTMLPAAVLERFGYFESFPQYVMFVTRLHNDLDVYRDFVDQFRARGQLPETVLDSCQNHDYVLPPTMCYHSFHQLAGTLLSSDRVITSRGRSFRYESKYHAGLERLWDFTIREVVFLGSDEFVADCRLTVMRRVFALIDELELTATCEVANDHFFGNAEAAAKILSQRMMELKVELLMPVGGGRQAAVSSFNLHGRLFGRSFDIAAADGTTAYSGCVGFGLERLAYVFVCQHGIDPSGWPDGVRAALDAGNEGRV